MNTIQVFIIIAFSGFTAWLLAKIITWNIFSPLTAISIGPLRIQGMLPANRENLASKVSNYIAEEFNRSSMLTERFADPELFAVLKPEIEKHVDLFLQEKLPVVFPLLSKFMGEKTLNQFRQAFLAEIDLLFPVLMNTYAGELKNNLALAPMIYEKLVTVSLSEARDTFYAVAKNNLLRFQVMSAIAGLLLGVLEVILLNFLH